MFPHNLNEIEKSGANPLNILKGFGMKVEYFFPLTVIPKANSLKKFHLWYLIPITTIPIKVASPKEKVNVKDDVGGEIPPSKLTKLLDTMYRSNIKK